MAYYIKDTGTEVFLYDTEETAARSLNMRTKQLQGYTFNAISPLFNNHGYSSTLNLTCAPIFLYMDRNLRGKING
jgi:hypothetical protein